MGRAVTIHSQFVLGCLSFSQRHSIIEIWTGRSAGNVERADGNQGWSNSNADDDNQQRQNHSSRPRKGCDVNIIPVILLRSGQVGWFYDQLIFPQELLSLWKLRHTTQAPPKFIPNRVHQCILLTHIHKSKLRLEVPEVDDGIDRLKFLCNFLHFFLCFQQLFLKFDEIFISFFGLLNHLFFFLDFLNMFF